MTNFQEEVGEMTSAVEQKQNQAKLKLASTAARKTASMELLKHVKAQQEVSEKNLQHFI